MMRDRAVTFEEVVENTDQMSEEELIRKNEEMEALEAEKEEQKRQAKAKRRRMEAEN